MKTCIKCGSHAFNLYAEEIDQGGLCDVHYWQGRAHRAEAQPEQEPVALQMDVIVVNLVREGINKHRARELAEHFIKNTTPPQRPWVGLTDDEMQALWDRYAHMEMMRAIEAKLKAVNGFLKLLL